MRTETKVIAANEIEPKAKRRKFTASYKARIIAEADACKEDGQVGALLRREGLYSSHLCTWRAQARTGSLKALGRKRGPKKKRTEAQRRADELERENARLRAKLRHAEDIIEIQKKLSRILGVQLNPNETESECDNE
jgi:transposase-like protein